MALISAALCRIASRARTFHSGRCSLLDEFPRECARIWGEEDGKRRKRTKARRGMKTEGRYGKK